MKKRYIIFDFDGTLVNTNQIIIDSWQASFEHFLGHRVPNHVIEATFGEVLSHTIARMMPGIDVDEVVEFYRQYQNRNKSHENVKVFDGIRELLPELRKRGCIIGVGTSRTTSSFWNYMEMFGLKDSIDEVVTMNDVEKHKPHPETINAVLLKMMAHDKRVWNEIEEGGRSSAHAVGFASTADSEDAAILQDVQDAAIPQDVLDAAIMIGDTKYDIGCAQNAGIDSVLVGWSHYIDEEELKASGFTPTYRIQSPEEILSII